MRRFLVFAVSYVTIYLVGCHFIGNADPKNQEPILAVLMLAVFYLGFLWDRYGEKK